MMNRSTAAKNKNDLLYDKNYDEIIPKKVDCLSDNLSRKMSHLCDSINNICHQPNISLDEILKSSNSNSTLGKLYQLFLSLRNNKNSMNFIQFIKQIELLAKENQLSKEDLFKELLHQSLLDNNQNQSNNAFDSSLIPHHLLLNEYNNDLSQLKTYFIRHSNNSFHQMNCSTFIQCISQDMELDKVDDRLQLNEIFCQIYSSLVNQGVYIPASHRIDFHGFLLCLQQISRTFHFNLRILIKTLINTKQKSKINSF